MVTNTKQDMIIGTKEDITNHNFYIEAFMHDDGHFGIAAHIDKWGNVSHYMIKDKSKYDKLINLLKLRLGFLCDLKKETEERDEDFTIDTIVNHIDNVVFYLSDYLKDFEDIELQPRTDEEIAEYMDEAFDRVWLVRKQNMFCNIADGTETIDPIILEQCKKAIIESCAKYNIDFYEPVSDWDYGYWSGILAALRWVLGDEKNSLDT